MLFEKPIATALIKKYPAFFMEPESSSPCSHKLANAPYFEPDGHIPYLQMTFLQDPFQYHPPIYV